MRIARLESRPIGARSAVLTALLAAVLLAIAQPALATSVGEKIILRCTHEESLSGFSQSAYREALKEVRADTEEYSGCSLLIREAQAAAALGARGGGAASGAKPVPIAATPAEQRSIAHAEHADSETVSLGGHVIHPGVVHVEVASALSSLPTPLLVTLAFLLVCLLTVCGSALRKRVRARGSD
ncbi:MAG: hypothetical protein ABSG93_11095 [Solirubrobacteraceae bacterium]|jgi:hypothetical protein